MLLTRRKIGGRMRGVRGVILDRPYNGIWGILECEDSDLPSPRCEWRLILTVEALGDPMNEDRCVAKIESFLAEHACGKPPPN